LYRSKISGPCPKRKRILKRFRNISREKWLIQKRAVRGDTMTHIWEVKSSCEVSRDRRMVPRLRASKMQMAAQT
jgi:predicted metal-binding transcription factor (methanogenesis marker protein 9)